MTKIFFLCLSLLAYSVSHGQSLRGHNSEWQCASYDESNHQWLVKSKFQRQAINLAYSYCKKNSKQPATCQAAKEHCEILVHGKDIKPKWKCLALDKLGEAYRSDTYNRRNDAIIGARLLCKHQSSFPSSCYVRVITCKNHSKKHQL